jgi:hypothetical protein
MAIVFAFMAGGGAGDIISFAAYQLPIPEYSFAHANSILKLRE